MSEEQLGPNAQSFSDHVCAGLQAGGLDLADYSMLIVTDKNEVGLLMAQVPLSEMPLQRQLFVPSHSGLNHVNALVY